MADTEQEFPFGITSATKTSNASRNSASGILSTPTNYYDVAGLRARLSAINGAYYTTARLNQMTKNDMIYAVRANDDPTTINARGVKAAP